jgi:hypothetical protein
MSLPTSEKVQSFVLKTLDSQGSIANSNDLALTLENGQTVTFVAGEAQTLLKGALDSLASREVSTPHYINNPNVYAHSRNALRDLDALIRD